MTNLSDSLATLLFCLVSSVMDSALVFMDSAVTDPFMDSALVTENPFMDSAVVSANQFMQTKPLPRIRCHSPLLRRYPWRNGAVLMDGYLKEWVKDNCPMDVHQEIRLIIEVPSLSCLCL